MKNKNEVTGNLLLGCTVLRITREVPGANHHIMTGIGTDSSHNVVIALE